MESTACTNCKRPGNEKYCGHCGEKQAQRFPENELTEHLTAAWKRTKDATVDETVDEALFKRRCAAHAVADRHLRTHYDMAVGLGRPFTLPSDFAIPDVAEDAAAPKDKADES